jgi:putative colanic acid biosynthesis glycosyltransferase
METPAVSVIVPCYRAQETVGAALRSAAAQSVTTEVIVVDGSPDELTLQAIRSSGITPGILIHEPDGGVYDAINKGIERANGEWIYILGADDVLAGSDALAQLLAGHRSGILLLLGIIENTGRRHPGIPARHDSSLTRSIFIRNTVHQQGALYHRSLFDTFRFNPGLRVLGDYDFHLHLYRQRTVWAFVPVLVARCEAEGLSKHFGRDLYREEQLIKRSRGIPFGFVVWLKYLYKQVIGIFR